MKLIKNTIILVLFFLFNLPIAYASTTTYPVIIIGAGISGLAAAQKLNQAHIPNLIIEARNRIGGRIYTVHPWVKNMDLGAGWIHGKFNNPISKIVKAQHLNVTDTIYDGNREYKKFRSFVIYDENGKKIAKAKIDQLAIYAEGFFNHLKKLEHTKSSLDHALNQYLSTLTLNSKDKTLLHYMIVNVYLYEFAADLNQISTQSDNAYANSVITGDNQIIENGYNAILSPLVENTNIILNQPVYKIRYDKNGVDVYTDKNKYHANYVISTVPLGALKTKSIQFVPALPEAKQKAIKQLGMGVYNKVYLLFDYPFWDKDAEWIGLMPDNNKPIWDIMNFYKFTKIPALIVFTSGSLGAEVEEWNDQATIAKIMTLLKTIYGNAIPEPSSYVITRWNSDPFTRGSYSYLPVGASVDSYKILSQPVMHRLYFAGEATSTSDPATVPGAYLSGIRAASEVLGEIKKLH